MKHIAKLYRIAVALLVIVVAAGAAQAGAQIVGATLSGTVRDTTGAAVSGATVTVRQTETGATRILTTGADGRYSAPGACGQLFGVRRARRLCGAAADGNCAGRGQSLVVDFKLGVSAVHRSGGKRQCSDSQHHFATDVRPGRRAPGEGAAAERAQL